MPPPGCAMAGSVAGIALPEGDPGAIVDAAAGLGGAAAALGDASRTVGGAESQVGGWQGGGVGELSCSGGGV